MSYPKLHHTLPQTYLKFFSPSGNTIFRYDKSTGLIKEIGIKSASAITDFYTGTDENGKKDTSLENPFLSTVDGNYPGLIKKISSRIDLDLIKNDLLTLMSTGYARVPKQRDNIKRMLDDMKGQRRKLGIQSEDTNNNEVNLGMLAEMFVHAAVNTGNHFCVSVSDGDIDFITCDNPADTSFLPLTSETVLFILPEKRPLQYVTANKEAVRKLNQFTFEKAKRYVYAKTKESIEELLMN